jgi:SAM-dependent methyltransferase
MARRGESDPVIVSVGAYSTDPEAYVRRYSQHLLDRPDRFASLFEPPARILDLGCGPGRDLRIFGAAGHQPIGIDLNPAFVEIAQRHGEVVEADLRDVRSVFAPATFDGIWAQASLVHLAPTEVLQVLSDLRELLVPSGRLYACVPAIGESGWRDEDDGRRWYTTWPNDAFPNAVASAGFSIDDTTDGVYVEVWATRR